MATGYEQPLLILQVSLLYITAYYFLMFIDHQISNHYQNLGSRISLCIGCVAIIYNLYPSHELLDTAAVGYCSCIFFGSLGLFFLVIYKDRQQRQERSLFEFVCHFLYVQFPISRVKDSSMHLQLSAYNIIHMILTDLVPNCSFCYVLWITGGYLILGFNTCLNDATKVEMIAGDYLYVVYYTVVFTIYVLIILLNIAIGFQTITRCLTLNRYEWIRYNNYPMLSISVKECWSKNYNYLPRCLLHQHVFTPLVERGYPYSFAALMCFVMSGLLHVYVQWKQVNYGLVSTFCFFVLHGVITIVETYVYGKRERNELSTIELVLRICVTNIIFALTLPLYLGLVINQYPKYGLIIDEQYQDTFKSQFVQSLMPYLPSLKPMCTYPH
eukprot:215110_1